MDTRDEDLNESLRNEEIAGKETWKIVDFQKQIIDLEISVDTWSKAYEKKKRENEELRECIKWLKEDIEVLKKEIKEKKDIAYDYIIVSKEQYDEIERLKKENAQLKDSKGTVSAERIADILTGKCVYGICDYDTEKELEYFCVNIDDARRIGDIIANELNGQKQGVNLQEVGNKEG